MTLIFFTTHRSCYSYEFLLSYLYHRRRPKRPNFLMGILNNEGLFGFCILNTNEGEEMAFIEQRSREAL